MAGHGPRTAAGGDIFDRVGPSQQRSLQQLRLVFFRNIGAPRNVRRLGDLGNQSVFLEIQFLF